MPRTKLNKLLDKFEETKQKKITTRKKKIEKEGVTVLPKDYKLFCDTVFMCYIRYRDGWKCGLTGKQFEIGDYSKYQACHFVPKSRLAGRYMEENCHGQSAWCNYQESLGNPYWVKRFTDFMNKKYGRKKVNEIFKLNFSHSNWKLKDWKQKAVEVYNQACKLENGAEIVNNRLNMVFKTLRDKKKLEIIMKEITPVD
jgi:hypothetical protein